MTDITKEDIDYFKKKIMCLVNQAKVRNLKLVSDSWTISKSNNKYKIELGQRVFLLALFLEERACKVSGFFDTISYLYNIDVEILQWFSNGLCGSGIPYVSSHSSKRQYLQDVFEFGLKIRKEHF